MLNPLEVSGKPAVDPAALLDAVDQAIIATDLEGRVLYWSRFARELYGWSAAEAQGRRIQDLTPAPGLQQRAAEILASLRRGERWSGEFPVQRRDGSIFPAHVTNSPVRSAEGRLVGIVGVSMDISARKRVEAMLDSEERLRRIAESGMVGLLYWRLDGRITWANDHFLEMIGSTRADLAAGRLDWRRITPPEWAFIDERAQAQLVRTGATTPFEKEFLRTDGARVPVLLSAATFSATTDQGVTLVVDMTSVKQAEAKVRNAYAEARAAVREREEVVAIVSHDLRNPLHTITMASGLLSTEGLDPAHRDLQIQIIQRAASQMRRLIDDLLDGVRIRTGQLGISAREADPGELVREAARFHAPLAEDSAVTLTLADLPSLPPVQADRDRVLQVFSNLVGNAIHFTPGGGQITLGATHGTGEVVFWVRDTGHGISDEDQTRIFEPFWRSGSRERAGTGMGLTIAKGIVEAHGGTMRVQSAVGAGTTFSFSLPVAAAPPSSSSS